MLIFTRTLALALGLGLLSGGCAGSQRAPGSLAGLPAGTTTLRVANHVALPDELECVTVAVDGQPLALSSVPPSGGAPATLASLGLGPGPHTISVRVTAHAAGRAAPGDVTVVAAHQLFRVERGPAALTIDVRTGVPASASGAPLSVDLTILGGRLSPELGVAPPDDKDERCAGLLPIPRALCRAAADLGEATRRNDVVATLCLRDKIAEMRRLAIVGESGKGESVAMAEAQVGTLARQVDLCGGAVAGVPGPDGVTVTRLGFR